MSLVDLNPLSDEILARQRLERLLMNAVWLVRLRWVAVFGQFVTIGVAAVLLQVQLRLLPLMAVVALTAATNLGFTVWLARQVRRKDALSDRQLVAVFVTLMTLDLVFLTALLYFTGGPENPFTIFYFVNLALAAVLLPARWGWTLTTIAAVCLLGLFTVHQQLLDLDRTVNFAGQQIELQHLGLLVALVACATVVVYFITRVTRELRQRERELRHAEQQRARSQRVESLGTLAAGAGHELATPLSTIAVVSKELTRRLDDVEVPRNVLDDVALIRAEVDRCRNILDRMTGSLGQNKDEPWSEVQVGQIIEEVVDGLSEPDRVQVTIAERAKGLTAYVPIQSTAQAIRGVVQNAVDASDPNDLVDATVSTDDGQIRIEIRDRGTGMSEAVLMRAGEPFFTTKEPGKGMGLGLFLTRTVIERLGGTLRLESPQGQGVTAEIRIPIPKRDN